MADRLCLLACGNFKKEIDSILKKNEFKDIQSSYFAPYCFVQKLKKDTQNFSFSKSDFKECGKLEVICGPFCIKGIEFKKDIKDKVHLVQEKNCLNFLINSDMVESLIDNKYFLLYPGLLRQWETVIEDTWGFDKKTARDFFSESSNKLLLLDTGVDPEARKNIVNLSNYLDLGYEVFEAGLGHLELVIRNLNFSWEKEKSSLEYQRKIAKVGNKIAAYEFTFDILKELVNIVSEEEIIKKIFTLFDILFRPKKIFYGLVENGQIARFYGRGRGGKNLLPGSKEAKKKMLNLCNIGKVKEYRVVGKNSFLLKISYKGTKFGYVLVEGIEIEKYLKRYLNEILSFRGVFGLAIFNARRYDEIEELKENYRFLSYHDSLTSLYNRSYFEEELQRIGRDLSRFLPFTVVTADINKLKDINDEYGHSIGDLAIKGVAEIFSSIFRKSDVIARIGGDEFCVLMPNTAQSTAEEKLRQLEKKIYNFNLKEKGISISVALGHFTATDASMDMKEILKKSDEEMYKNKRKEC
ncbi:MAG: GGDEF domain-containing protein [Actinomycetota bacterium]